MNILMLTRTPNVDDNLPYIIYDDGDEETFPERAKAYFEKDVLAETADGIQLDTHWDDEKHCGRIVYPDGSSIQYICTSARDLSSAMEEDELETERAAAAVLFVLCARHGNPIRHFGTNRPYIDVNIYREQGEQVTGSP